MQAVSPPQSATHRMTFHGPSLPSSVETHCGAELAEVCAGLLSLQSRRRAGNLVDTFPGGREGGVARLSCQLLKGPPRRSREAAPGASAGSSAGLGSRITGLGGSEGSVVGGEQGSSKRVVFETEPGPHLLLSFPAAVVGATRTHSFQAWLPARAPSPGPKAASGLLVPSVLSSPLYGLGKVRRGQLTKVSPRLERSGLRAAFLPPGPLGDRYTESVHRAGAAGRSGKKARTSIQPSSHYSVTPGRLPPDPDLSTQVLWKHLPHRDVGGTRGEGGTHERGVVTLARSGRPVQWVAAE